MYVFPGRSESKQQRQRSKQNKIDYEIVVKNEVYVYIV